MPLWLSDHTQAAADFARKYLPDRSGSGNSITGAPHPFISAGLIDITADFDHNQMVEAPVETTQTAPVILRALGLNPQELKTATAGAPEHSSPGRTREMGL